MCSKKENEPEWLTKFKKQLEIVSAAWEKQNAKEKKREIEEKEKTKQKNAMKTYEIRFFFNSDSGFEQEDEIDEFEN